MDDEFIHWHTTGTDNLQPAKEIQVNNPQYPRFATRDYWVAQIDGREAALQRVLDLHSKCECDSTDHAVPACVECDVDYPCLTVRVLEGQPVPALEDEQA